MYRVIKYFEDKQDERHPYNVGDTFPREGLEVTPERFEELASDKNRRKRPLIEKVEEPKKEPTEEPKEEPKPETKPKRSNRKKG